MARKRRKSVLCHNCNYRFAGIDNYCPNCGQENHSHHAPFQHLFLELIESLTHFDTKFFASTKALWLRPGRLTKDYIEDRRARYVPPVRMYVFVSFVFFFSLSLFSSSDYEIARFREVSTDTVGEIRVSRRSGLSVGDAATADRYAAELKTRLHITNETIDSLIESKEPDAGWLRRLFLRQSMKQALGMITQKQIEHAVFKNAGIGLFILMPVFAALLKLLYLQKRKTDRIRPKRLYIEHLIFSVHFHSFVFAILLVVFILSRIANDEVFVLAGVIIIPIYCTIAMRKVYERSWWTTILRAIALFSVYTIVIFMATLIIVLLSFATL